MAKQVLVNLNLNGNEIQNVAMQCLATDPTSGTLGQYIYNTTDKKAKQWDGSAWKVIGGVVDAALSDSSENAVQNKAVKAELDKKANTSALKTVATSGSYNDLTDKPTIPTVPASLKNPYALTFSGASTVSYDGSAAKTVNIPTIPASLKNPNALKIGGTLTYDGSAEASITAGTNVQISSTGAISATDTKYSAATTSAAGLMSAADKTKLDGIATGANKTTVDSAMSSTSTNPVQNKVVQAAIADAIAASDAMIFKGTLGTGGTITALPTTYKTGWTYRVITAGTYAGNACEVGDLIIALVDRAGSGNVNTDWTVAQTNIDGAITDVKGTSPIKVAGTGASRTVSHVNSGIGDSGKTIGSKTAQTPIFGGTFNVPFVIANSTGHVTDGHTATVTIPSTVATTSTAGLMSGSDKTKLDGIATGANKTTVDSALSSTSTNPVQNKIINTALGGKANVAEAVSDFGTDKNATSFTIAGMNANGVDLTSAIILAATQTYAGVMSAADKTKLDGVPNFVKDAGRIPAGATSMTRVMSVAGVYVLSIEAWDSVTKEGVIVDWSVNERDTTEVTFSIAKAHANDIAFNILGYTSN